MKKVFTVTLILFSFLAFSQTKEIDEWVTNQEYQESVEGVSYIEKNQEVDKPIRREVSPSPYLELITNALAVIAVLLLLGFIAYFIKISIDKRRKGSKETNISRIKALSLKDAEENLDMRDLSHLLDKAKEDKDYKLLIRLHYLHTLQYLNDNEYIVWKMQKTDYHYLSEVKKQKFQRSFYHLITIFQNTWYGLSQPEEVDVETVEYYIKKLKNNS